MPMYMDHLGNIFSIAPNGNKSFDEACFQVDTLMTPIISVLLKKGYKTRATCSGHVSTVYCPNYDDCIDDPEIKYETEKNLSVDMPYIMFDDDIKVPLEDLPESWEWEYSTTRSINITSEEEFRKTKYFQFKVGDIIPVFENAKNGFNLAIRPNIEYYGLYSDNWYDPIRRDPFIFYCKLVSALHELYLWAVKLPAAQVEPKEHKRGFFKSK